MQCGRVYTLNIKGDEMVKIDENNIEYAVFQNANGKYCVRSIDIDSGEVITIRVCQSEEQAAKIYGEV